MHTESRPEPTIHKVPEPGWSEGTLQDTTFKVRVNLRV